MSQTTQKMLSVMSKQPELISNISMRIQDVYVEAPRGVSAIGRVKTNADTYFVGVYLAISSIPVRGHVGVMGSVEVLDKQGNLSFEKVFYMPTSSSLEELKHLIVYGASRLGVFDEDCVIEIENEQALNPLLESADND